MVRAFYCSSVWSNTAAKNVKKLQLIQNFAARIITNTYKYDHITPVLQELKWLPVDRNLVYRENHLFSVSLWRRANARNVRPYYPYWQYTDLFIFRFVSPLCLRSTLRLFRNINDLVIPKFQTSTGQISFPSNFIIEPIRVIFIHSCSTLCNKVIFSNILS